MRTSIRLVVSLCMVALVFSGCSSSMKEESMAMPTAEDFKKFAMPTEEHKVLEPFVGTWKTEGKFWMMPGEPPMVTTGTSVVSMELGGKFIEEHYDSSWMGSPFKGIGYTGYDTVSKEYTSTWMDSATSITHVMKGSYNDMERTMELKGENNCPMSGAKIPGRTVIHVKDDNTHVLMSYHMDPNGVEQKGMEITYSRIK